MEYKEKVVLRFINGKGVRGYLKSINHGNETIPLETKEGRKEINLSELKAIYFVKTFKGDREYQERNVYGLTKTKGKRVIVKFKDGELITGFLEGSIPWKKGFFLDNPDPSQKGFFLLPTDERSNNIKIFVVNSSIEEVVVP